jgi:hypothetical protein
LPDLPPEFRWFRQGQREFVVKPDDTITACQRAKAQPMIDKNEAMLTANRSGDGGEGLADGGGSVEH